MSKVQGVDELSEELSQRELAVAKALRYDRGNPKSIGFMIGKHPETVRESIRNLDEKGFVRSEGPRSARTYHLEDSADRSLKDLGIEDILHEDFEHIVRSVEGDSITDIAEEIDKTPSTVNRKIKKLTEEGELSVEGSGCYQKDIEPGVRANQRVNLGSRLNDDDPAVPVLDADEHYIDCSFPYLSGYISEPEDVPDTAAEAIGMQELLAGLATQMDIEHDRYEEERPELDKLDPYRKSQTDETSPLHDYAVDLIKAKGEMGSLELEMEIANKVMQLLESEDDELIEDYDLDSAYFSNRELSNTLDVALENTGVIMTDVKENSDEIRHDSAYNLLIYEG